MSNENIDTCSSCLETKKILARGYCNACYHRLRRYGDPGVRKYKQPPKPCYVRGCSRDANIQGLYPGMCKSHVDQMRRGKPLRTIDVTDLDGDGLKQCRKCGDWFPGDEDWAGYATWCTRCTKDRDLQRDHGISVERFEQMVRDQGGRCQICLRTPDVLYVDHDHSCCPPNDSGRSKGGCGACVRGLLCRNCNLSLGLVCDDVEVLRKMIEYLS